MNIKRKHVDLDTRCPVCSRLDEDGGHIFLKCKFAKRLWRALNLDAVRLQLLNYGSARAAVEAICSLKTEGKIWFAYYYGTGGQPATR